MLDPNEQKMLKEALELAQENNKMLRKMRRAQAWGTAWKVVYWGVFVVMGVLSYYYLQPVLEQLFALYGGLTESVGNLQSAGDQLKGAGENIPDIGALLEQFGR